MYGDNVDLRKDAVNLKAQTYLFLQNAASKEGFLLSPF